MDGMSIVITSTMKVHTLSLLTLISITFPQIVTYGKEISCSKLHSFWKERILTDFQVIGAEPLPKCESIELKVSEAFLYIWEISLVGEEQGSNWKPYAWVKKRLKEIYFENVYPEDIPGAHLVLASSDRKGGITFYKRYKSRSLIRRIGTVIHESRHMDKDDPGHIICKTGPLIDTFSCDPWSTTLVSGGAYNYQLLFWDAVMKEFKFDGISASEIEKEISFIRRAHITKPTGDEY
jgi:hypothetical protein